MACGEEVRARWMEKGEEVKSATVDGCAKPEDEGQQWL